MSTIFNMIFKETVHDRYQHTWRINIIDSRPVAELPINDTLYLITHKGLSSYDTIQVLGFTTSVESGESFPPSFRLQQNYPNPFNPVSAIRYSLAVRAYVRVKIYDVLGREVTTLVDGVESPGEKSVNWNASGLASGVYFYRLEATSATDPARAFTHTRKMLLVR
jgi:hypothetical protein